MSALKVGVVSLIVGAIFTIAILVTPSWFPTQASVEAERQDLLYLALMIMSAFIMGIVITFLGYCIWKFRARPGDEERDGPPIHGHTTLEIVWTVIPTIIVLGFAVAGGVVLVRNETKAPDHLNVQVQAQQFAWTFKYEGGVQSPILMLPVDRNVEFDITSLQNDVIHSFYVPQFRVKQDAVPGIVTHTYATPTREGTYAVICTELCGAGHSLMRAPVQVLSQEAFNSWLKQEQGKKTAQGGSG
ncbi:MAG: cytochrome c oxidase subunit [Gaiellales bacterium]|nr:cytochrome c oxidase subunit [Gaiellales bacterium]